MPLSHRDAMVMHNPIGCGGKRFLTPLLMACLVAVAANADEPNANPNPKRERESSTAASPRRPNVLFLLTDDQRPDTIAALGNPAIRTPNLDALVRSGTTFTRAICANPICTPSRAEILSGCTGFTNGVLDFGKRIDPGLKLWPQAMREAGYHTWYVGKWHNDGRPHLRGYEETLGLFAGGGSKWWKDQVDHHGRPVTGYRGWVFQSSDGKEKHPERGVGLTADISAKFADAAVELIRRKSEKPFFLHVNFTAPHDPLLMPPGYDAKYPPSKMALPKSFRGEHPFDHGNFRGRDEVLLPFPRTAADVKADLAVYYSVISHLDEQIGRVLKALKDTGQAENTLVIFASDHGLAMGSHGLRGKQNMYEHTIGVPLIVGGPGIPAGEKRDAQVYLRDLYPTVCDLAGIEIPRTVEGRSLRPVLAGEAKEVYPAVFGYFRGYQRMIRTKRWKLVHYPEVKRWQLFDLDADPDELHNLADDPRHAEVRLRLVGDLRRLQASVRDPAYNPTKNGE